MSRNSPSQEWNPRPALEEESQPLNHQGGPSSSCFELGLKEVLIFSMKVLAKGANNTLQVACIMKYDQPRKSPSFTGRWAVFTDDISTVEQAGPGWAQGFTGAMSWAAQGRIWQFTGCSHLWGCSPLFRVWTQAFYSSINDQWLFGFFSLQIFSKIFQDVVLKIQNVNLII